MQEGKEELPAGLKASHSQDSLEKLYCDAWDGGKYCGSVQWEGFQSSGNKVRHDWQVLRRVLIDLQAHKAW